MYLYIVQRRVENNDWLGVRNTFPLHNSSWCGWSNSTNLVFVRWYVPSAGCIDPGTVRRGRLQGFHAEFPRRPMDGQSYFQGKTQGPIPGAPRESLLRLSGVNTCIFKFLHRRCQLSTVSSLRVAADAMVVRPEFRYESYDCCFMPV